MLAAGTLCVIASIPGQTMGVSVFTPRLQGAFRLSEGGLSSAYGLGTLLSGLLIARAGRWVDRFGVRRTAVVTCLLMGVPLAMLASSAQLRALGGDAAAWGFGLAAVCFFLLRFLGQGLLALIPRVMIGKWFERRRGLATGISGLFISFGFGIAPLGLKGLIDRFGWSGAYWVLAGAVSLGMGAVALIFFRERPQDFGLEPDGGYVGGERKQHRDSLPAVKEFTLNDARRTMTFWVYTAALSLQGMLITAITFHIVAIAEEAGMTENRAVQLFFPMAVVSVCTNFTAGYISDKTRLRYLLIVHMLTLGMGTVSLAWFNTSAGWWAAILGFGMSGGLFSTLVSVSWPRFFGTTHLGAISGQNMAMMVLSTSVGPLMYSAIRDWSGSFDVAFFVSGCFPLAVLLLLPWAGNPQDKFR